MRVVTKENIYRIKQLIKMVNIKLNDDDIKINVTPYEVTINNHRITTNNNGYTVCEPVIDVVVNREIRGLVLSLCNSPEVNTYYIKSIIRDIYKIVAPDVEFPISEDDYDAAIVQVIENSITMISYGSPRVSIDLNSGGVTVEQFYSDSVMSMPLNISNLNNNPLNELKGLLHIANLI